MDDCPRQNPAYGSLRRPRFGGGGYFLVVSIARAPSTMATSTMTPSVSPAPNLAPTATETRVAIADAASAVAHTERSRRLTHLVYCARA